MKIFNGNCSFGISPSLKQRYLMFISCKSISKICYILWGFMIFGYKHTIQRTEMNIKICIIRYKATTNRVFIRGWEVSTIIYYMLRDFIMKRNWIYWINAKMCWIPFIILITDTIFSSTPESCSYCLCTTKLHFQLFSVWYLADGFYANLVIYNDLTKQKVTRHWNSLKKKTEYRKRIHNNVLGFIEIFHMFINKEIKKTIRYTG